MHEITFAGHGGEQAASWFGPRDARCVIGVAPALGLRADYYRPLAEALVASGDVAVVTADLPGHGKSPVRASRRHDWGYREIVDHLAALRRNIGARSFVWLGHSIGGQIALMDGEHADAVILVASSAPHYRSWHGLARARVLVGTQLTALLGGVIGHYPGEAMRFGGREARTLMANWAEVARSGRYVFGSFDGDAAMGRVHAPVLAITLEGDTLAPPPAVEHTLAKLHGATLTRRFWSCDAQGDLARGNQHNRWPRSPAFVVRESLDHLARVGLLGQPARHAS